MYLFFLFFLSFISCFILTAVFLYFSKVSNIGQAIREEGPASHFVKSGTPTMGGIVFILTIISASFVFFKDDLDLGIKDYDGIVMDIVTRTKGKQQTRVPTYRPLIKSWKAKGTLQIIEGDGLTDEFLKQAIQLAGLKYGLLSNRPDFGRFKLNKWG